MQTLTAAKNAGAPNWTMEFKYDAFGRRVEKKKIWPDYGNYVEYTETFVYDGWNPVARLRSGSLYQTYLWGLDLSGSMGGAGGVGGLLMVHKSSSGSVHFPCYDGNGNVMSLVNASSQAVEADYAYDPFGRLQRVRGTGNTEWDNPFRFSTKYTDDETELLYYGFRYYAPETGRWLSRDPIEEAGGLNLYGFVGNDGVNRWDLVGLDDPNKPWRDPKTGKAPWEADTPWRDPKTGKAPWDPVIPPTNYHRDPNIDASNEQFDEVLEEFAFPGGEVGFLFTEDDPWTKALMKKTVYEKMRIWIRKSARKHCAEGSVPDFILGSPYPWDDTADDDPFYTPVIDIINYFSGAGLKSLGSNDGKFYIKKVDCTTCDVSIDMVVEDSFRWGSATRIPGTDRSFWPGVDEGIGGSAWGMPSEKADNPFGQDGPLGTVYVRWTWSETISFQR